MIDLLTSLAVVALLIGLMLPGLSKVQETTRQVICASNVRQLGIGVASYAEDWRDYLPPSIFVQHSDKPEETMTLRSTETAEVFGWSDGWDGLGLLHSAEYLVAQDIFYCPSHRGEHPASRYRHEWQTGQGTILGNYQYRGQGPNGTRFLGMVRPSRSALITDGMRTAEDFNHRSGANVLRADLSVYWFSDTGGRVISMLTAHSTDPGDGSHIRSIWGTLDNPNIDDDDR